jgi:hypothetical protein
MGGPEGLPAMLPPRTDRRRLAPAAILLLVVLLLALGVGTQAGAFGGKAKPKGTQRNECRQKQARHHKGRRGRACTARAARESKTRRVEGPATEEPAPVAQAPAPQPSASVQTTGRGNAAPQPEAPGGVLPPGEVEAPDEVAPPGEEEVARPPVEEEVGPPVEEVLPPPAEEEVVPPVVEEPPVEEEVVPPVVEEPPVEDPGSPPEEPEAEPELPGPVPFRFFSPGSIWNAPLPADAALDPESEALAGALREEVERELAAVKGPSLSTTSYSVPIYTVPADQPTVPVALTTRFNVPALVSAWQAVPLPEEAHAAAGSDGHLVVWQPSSDRLWEFWRLSRQDGAWQAPWGGAIRNVSSSSGVYSGDAWPGANGTWGASACGLSIAGGLVTLEELERGSIEHALALSLPQIRAGVFSSPATRSDGRSNDPLSLPEGARLRIDPELDLSQLRLPPLTRMLAEAAQRYGIVVRDVAGSVTFYGEDPTRTGENPYFGPGGYFEGNYAAKNLAKFPWADLQVLQMDLHPTR